MNKDAMLLYSNNRICSIHFDANLMTNHRLSKNAIPTLNLFRKPRGIVVQTQTEDKMGTEGKRVAHIETQTTKELSHQTPRKRKLRHLIESEENEIKRMKFKTFNLEQSIQEIDPYKTQLSKDKFKKACDIHLPNSFGNIAKIISDLNDKNLKGRRYTKEFKQHALSLYYSGPKIYKRMVAIYNFPSVSTLRRMTENIQKGTGLNDFIFRSLKWRLKGKSKEDRMCALSMDEVSIKANLQYDTKNDEIVGFHNIG
ncbi:uncharacterized protein LOC123678460 [Harmonia axyridis]|uniref:uncharacterized protein LOC123678460 n=1 Tax=Harmonia axyridis TaxID=115357 RepID=UPI001E27512D|nr:uncharacterized protein LOC123678460 [Harmonia axyridis]